MVSQINYPLTNFADPGGRFSHDAINRYLRGERIPPRRGWENVRDPVVATGQGYVVVDDPVVDKHASSAIALGRYQYSGNAQAVITGLGVVTGGYVHPGLDPFWLNNYRRYDPDGDGKTQLDPVRERRVKVGPQKPWPVPAVRLDPWEATKALRLRMEGRRKVSYCPFKANRQGDAAGGPRPDGRVAALAWKADAGAHGQRLQLKGFPNEPKGRRFRVAGSTHRTDWVVTTAPPPAATAATRAGGGFRWKLEPGPREGKPVTGLERCQCRKARRQRNHRGGAFLVWVRLKELAGHPGRPVYHLQQGLLDDYLLHQLKNPSLKMVLA